MQTTTAFTGRDQHARRAVVIVLDQMVAAPGAGTLLTYRIGFPGACQTVRSRRAPEAALPLVLPLPAGSVCKPKAVTLPSAIRPSGR
jgi:hypothetical protein